MSLSSVSRVMPLRLLPDPRPAGSCFMWIASAQLPIFRRSVPHSWLTPRRAPACCSLLVSLMLTHAPSSAALWAYDEDTQYEEGNTRW